MVEHETTPQEITTTLQDTTQQDTTHDIRAKEPSAPPRPDNKRLDNKRLDNKPIDNICVYCGSASGEDPVFVAAAREFGALLAAEDIGLVYGGGGRGLMGTLARSVLDHGGRVTGIIPDFLTDHEKTLREAQEHIVVPDMHTRKRLMFERADAFVALPGGVGTLEELVEQLTWVQLERHTKPVLIADIGGFWHPLLALLSHMRHHGFINPSIEIRYLVAETVDEIVPMLRAALARMARAGLEKETVDSRL